MKKNQGKFLKKPDTPPAVTSAPEDSQASRPKVAVIVLAVLSLCVCAVASVFFLNELGVSIPLPGRTIAENVTVAGVDVGGLKRGEAIDAVEAAVGDSYSSQTLTISVFEETLQLAPADSGTALDVRAAVRAAFDYGTPENPEERVDIIPYLNLNTEAIKASIQAFAVKFPTEGIATSTQLTTDTADGQERDVLNVTLGTVYYDFDPDALYETVLKAYRNHVFEAVYSCNLFTAEEVDLDALFAQYQVAPVDASLDPQTYEVIPSSVGYQFDLEDAKAQLAAAKPGDTLTLPFHEVAPELDTETLKSMLFRDVLGTYTAVSSSSYNRDTNLRLACEALDGIILYPGDVISYNETLGERTPEKGYKPADSYLGSKTVQTYGGGICQPSSSLYYCALIADLEIVERSNHGFISSYMPYGMDATVDWSGPDFKFRNSTDFPIRIDAKADGGTVTVSLIGTDTKDYYVEMEYEVWGVSYPKTVEKKVKPGSGHKDGEVETTPYTGYTIQTFKLKYDKETGELISREKEAYSVYSKRDKVVYKVVEEKKEDKEETKESVSEAGSDVSIPSDEED